MGALGSILGSLGGSPLAVLLGSFGAAASARYTQQATASQADAFTQAFQPGWQERIPAQQKARLLPRRWEWVLPEKPQPVWERDVPFWTIPGSQRKLLADLWQPPPGAYRSGLAFLYFHGSAWYLLDKDTGTRTFFSHLVSQGHMVMDVAYRLFPETDIAGMVGDVQRAIAWMKANAARYQVDPQRIVLSGGSAGGHLSMLAAYASDHPQLTPEDVRSADLAVRAVVSCYGPTDLAACYYHTHQDQTTSARPPTAASRDAAHEAGSNWMRALMGENYERLGMDKGMEAGSFVSLIGGTPEQAPEKYALLSPVTHVHAGCPPTLLIQGQDDLITSVEATRALYQKLVSAGVPAILIVYPQTDHAFDLMLPRLSPTAQSALYDIERFLALVSVS
jgi:acetyl esterase/lipase